MIDDVRDAARGDAAENATPAAPELPEVPLADPEVSPAVEAFASGSAAGELLASSPAVDFKDRWLRSEAEMQNFRRRAARDRDEAVARAQETVLLEVIGVLDDLERALAALAPEQAAEPWVQGVALTARRMLEVLARWDVVPIEAMGKPFDPMVHEALLEIDAPQGATPGTVVQVALTGYRRGERALRAARVVVARARS